ncbi:Glycosyl transferase family 2 [Gaiella occulta]|uniref:Glycosyl transferase family 2 n=1 Tax=Gaiella occulta TaxID=1002870 RepID=A0A7M2YXX2_9ACTN|nr:Glycosyl transferase family 2 [Gaiella occulta]
MGAVGSAAQTANGPPAAKVSIGIPVYNGAQFLAASLESLLAQTYEDIEFVISDNGSTDGTEAICREFAARDGRIRYLRADTNRGASWNYRNVVQQTSGPYFKWATHDDLLAPTYIERCVEVLDAAPAGVALVYPRTRIIDGDGNVVRDYDDNLDIRAKTPHERLRLLVGNIVMANASFGLIRRTALARSRLLDKFPSADYVMMAEFALFGEFWEIPEFLFFRREHEAMSRKANPSATEAAEWFEPGSSKNATGREFWRLFVEHLRSIHHARLDPVEKAKCYAGFLGVWTRRYRRAMVDEIFVGRQGRHRRSTTPQGS